MTMRDERVELRVSLEEKAAWVAAARSSGLQVSQWIRLVLDAEIKRRKRRHP